MTKDGFPYYPKWVKNSEGIDELCANSAEESKVLAKHKVKPAPAPVPEPPPKKAA